MENKNKGALILGCVLFSIVVASGYSIYEDYSIKHTRAIKETQKENNPAMDDVPIENYVPTYEEPTIEPVKEEPKEEEPKEEVVEIINNTPSNREDVYKNIEKELKQMGYKEEKLERCGNDKKCFTNNKYLIHYTNGWVEIERSVNPDKINTYDTKNDLLLIGKLFENESIADRKKVFNELFAKFDRADGLHNFFIKIDGLFISVYYSLDNVLSYSIGNNERDINVYDFEYLDTMLNDTKSKSGNNMRKTLYDFSIKNKKKYFPYYDLIKYYLDFGKNQLCDYNMNHNQYTFESSYCHGGTSNTIYSFNYNENYKKQDIIEIEVKNTLFESENTKLIEHDLEYLNGKLKTKFKLSKADSNEIKKLLKHDEGTYSFVIDYKLEVTITHKKYNEYANYYTIKYLINK